jgi:putative ABC transport system permease protein
VPGVEQVSAWTWFQGVYKEPKNFFARFAVDPDIIFDLRQDFRMPPDQIEAFKRGRTACVVGQKIADQYNIKVGDAVTIVGDIYNVTLELTCVGIFQHEPNNECLLFHREYLTELLPATSPQRDSVGTYAILATTPDDVPRVAKAIDTMFENSPYPTRTESEKEFGRSFLAFLGNIKLFLAAICAAVTFTILLVSANTIAMSVRERTRELAILRTLGYTPGEILGLVLGEAVVISLAGGRRRAGDRRRAGPGDGRRRRRVRRAGHPVGGRRRRARGSRRDRPPGRARAGRRRVAEERRGVPAVHGLNCTMLTPDP